MLLLVLKKTHKSLIAFKVFKFYCIKQKIQVKKLKIKCWQKHKSQKHLMTIKNLRLAQYMTHSINSSQNKQCYF